MAIGIEQIRKVLALDPADPLTRFALGKKLLELGTTPAQLEEAANHLRFANAKSPTHLATYHVLAQVLIKLGKDDEAKQVLRTGIDRVAGVGEGMGRDLGPAMSEMLAKLG